MKQIKSFIKLTNLSSEKINEKELNHVIGGDCKCGCYYALCSGSSETINGSANSGKGLVSPNPLDLEHASYGYVVVR